MEQVAAAAKVDDDVVVWVFMVEVASASGQGDGLQVLEAVLQHLGVHLRWGRRRGVAWSFGRWGWGWQWERRGVVGVV